MMCRVTGSRFGKTQHRSCLFAAIVLMIIGPLTGAAQPEPSSEKILKSWGIATGFGMYRMPGWIHRTVELMATAIYWP